MQPVLVPNAFLKGFILRKAFIFPVLRRFAQTIHPQTMCHPGEGLSHLFYHLPSPLCALLSCTLGLNQVLWHKPRLTAGSWFSK